jgi:perosamine synthetase
MTLNVPFFKPDLTPVEIQEVVDTLQSGWLTTGPRVHRFEQDFASAVGGRHAVAVNSCTAALHLALEALDVKPGQGVLVPTMTFAATAEVVAYLRAVPVLVDCDPLTGNMDLNDAQTRCVRAAEGRLPGSRGESSPRDIVGIMPVHVGGLMMDVQAIEQFAERGGYWIVEDAAHAFPAARRRADGRWQRCGAATASVTCFSFYANKTITTGEGGIAVTDDEALADRMRLMSLHGLSRDAWDRYSANGSWDYQIVAPGFKYNLTDVAAALGIHQLARADAMRVRRQEIAMHYCAALADVDELELPPTDDNAIHSWHLFTVQLRLDKLSIDRNGFIDELGRAGVKCSVHWRPLHLHPYYREAFGYRPQEFPNATARFARIISLPLFPGMSSEQIDHVVASVRDIVARHRR